MPIPPPVASIHYFCPTPSPTTLFSFTISNSRSFSYWKHVIIYLSQCVGMAVQSLLPNEPVANYNRSMILSLYSELRTRMLSHSQSVASVETIWYKQMGSSWWWASSVGSDAAVFTSMKSPKGGTKLIWHESRIPWFRFAPIWGWVSDVVPDQPTFLDPAFCSGIRSCSLTYPQSDPALIHQCVKEWFIHI